MATPLKVSAVASEAEQLVGLVYLQSAITMGNMKIVKVTGGIELRSGPNTAFVPDGNIKVMEYK